ncbi:ankyrin repeat-containing domain protein, partial [Powellomyces hirtus]
MPLHDAAYLGIAADQIPLVPKHYLTHPDELGSTPLMKAAAKGHLHIVEALLARSVDLNAVDRFGNTALVWAAYAGKRDVVKELTAQKHCVSATPPTSSPTLPDPAPGWTYQNAMTPLIAASIAGHPSIIEHLLDCGA